MGTSLCMKNRVQATDYNSFDVLSYNPLSMQNAPVRLVDAYGMFLTKSAAWKYAQKLNAGIENVHYTRVRDKKSS